VGCPCREQWLAAAQKVFKALDFRSNGLTMERLMCVLREKLPAAEVEYAVEDALVDAGYKGESLLALASTLLPCQPLLTVHCATSVYVCTCTRLHRDVNSAVNWTVILAHAAATAAHFYFQ